MKTYKPMQIRKKDSSISDLNYLKKLIGPQFFNDEIFKEPLPKNEPTVREMIAYCEKFIANLRSEIANGDGEEWMRECIKMEEAIIEILKSNVGKSIT